MRLGNAWDSAVGKRSQEGRLAAAQFEWHSISGGKPPFLTERS